MESEQLLEELGYSESIHFLRAESDALRAAPDHGHIFRHAADDFPKRLGDRARLLGVYSLTGGELAANDAHVPLVYVCHAEDSQSASEIHRLTWCQDVVPFVLVHTPDGLILHSGFWFERKKGGQIRGVLERLRDFNACQDLIREFSASSIDTSSFWQTRRKDVHAHRRVDWKLLRNLKKLNQRLRSMGLNRDTSQALIGKYVFLHYLRDRKILSPRKLDGWGLKAADVFGRAVTVKGLRSCLDHLEEWLNGGVFPITWSGTDSPKAEHVRAVAATFAGDEPVGSDLWQLAFDFQVYDFSYIPIETLSVIYEQFLHSPDSGGTSKGKKRGAYYTPIPLVNLMLAEVEERKPIQNGIRVLDPACGSGAFLVQAYRHLIEREFPPTSSRPSPKELRQLLTTNIFGVDRDKDACSVTKFSLLLTLLDCVDPPDLEQSTAQKRFKLPNLRGKNVIHADFFDESSKELQRLRSQKFDVILGNPPWITLNPQKLDAEDKPVWKWISERRKKGSETPVGGNQVAQAFTWAIRDDLNSDGEVALLIPGITLFEDRSTEFRRRFFTRYDVHSVINFANLAEVLFAGRSRVPAAAFFFGIPDDEAPDPSKWVRTFAPLIANQEANRQIAEGDRTEMWSLVVHQNEIRDLPPSETVGGSGLTWKIAAWASARDVRLLNRLGSRFDPLENLEHNFSDLIFVTEGLQLRQLAGSGEELEPVPEVVGQDELDVEVLKRTRNIFAFPQASLVPVYESRGFARKGRVKLPLSVCRPPHVIVSAARTFAVYSEEFIVVPPRQIGIVSTTDDETFLKALSLYLSSDFAFYHQFLSSPHFGVKRDVATLRALRELPIPLVQLSREELDEWAVLHAKLAMTRPRTLDELREDSGQQLTEADDGQPELLAELNERVFDALKMTQRDRALVHDLVHVRFALNDGHIGQPAVRSPKASEMRTYGRRLQKELNGFVGDIMDKRHHVRVVHDGLSGMVAVDFVSNGTASRSVPVMRADRTEAAELRKTRDHLREKYSQWIYFDRNLRVYDEESVFIMKPMQRFHWTESQAMDDAARIIAETLGAETSR